MNKKNMRRVSLLVTAQTAKNLDRLAAMSGYYEVGRVVDKLVREKMISLRCEKEGMACGDYSGERESSEGRYFVIGRKRNDC